MFLAVWRPWGAARGLPFKLKGAGLAAGPAVTARARVFSVAPDGFPLFVFRIAEKRLGRRAALAVDPAAGLHATAAQAAFAAHIAGPVTAPGHAIAQRPVDETFQIKAVRAGFAHAPDLVDGQFARQNHPVGAQRPGLKQGFGVGQVGQGGQEQPALETGLPGQIQHGQILDDQPVRAHLAGQTRGQPVGGGAFAGFDQGVHGHVDARVFGVGQIREPGQLGEAEVFRLHAGRKMLQAQINGVGSGGQGRQKRGGVPGRSENFGFARRGGGIFRLAHVVRGGGRDVLCAHIL